MTPAHWRLVALLSCTATASYLCRVNLSVAGALLMSEFALDQVQMGRVFSAFLIGYALLQAPAGWLVDRWGTRRVLAAASWAWVVVTAAQALVGVAPIDGSATATLASLLALRFVLGVAEAPTFSAAAHGIACWIPSATRARANGFVLAAIGLGSAMAPPLLSSTMVRFGWRTALFVSATPALLVALAWSRLSTPPESLTSSATAAAASTDGSTENRPAEGGMRAAPPRLLSRSFVFLTASYTLQGYVGYIFVFWFYLYLVQERHFDLLRGAAMSSLPWLLSIVSIPLGGWTSDWLVARGVGLTWGRRLVPLAGLGIAGALIVLGARTSSPYVAACVLGVATAGVLSVEGPFWATMTELAGSKSGVAGGVMNMGSNLGGLVSPALTPWLAARIGWERALDVAAVASIVGALLWLGVELGARGAAHDRGELGTR
ncbi:MAG: MFS transporter [Vicinamibacterales bacterium]